MPTWFQRRVGWNRSVPSLSEKMHWNLSTSRKTEEKKFLYYAASSHLVCKCLGSSMTLVEGLPWSCTKVQQKKNHVACIFAQIWIPVLVRTDSANFHLCLNKATGPSRCSIVSPRDARRKSSRAPKNDGKNDQEIYRVQLQSSSRLYQFLLQSEPILWLPPFWCSMLYVRERLIHHYYGYKYQVGVVTNLTILERLRRLNGAFIFHRWI